MVKPIKPPKPKGVPAIAIPFPPTQTPSHSEVAAAASALLTLAQVCFQGNPGPVITALKCAEATYVENAEKNGGMAVDDIEKFEVLGVALSKALLEQAEKQKEQEESGILTPDTRLVGPDGRPIASMPMANAPGPAKQEPVQEESTKEEKPSGIILDSKG